jgi:outer membrane immunogenic protein
LAEVGAAYKFDAPAGWGDPAPLRPMASPFVVDAPWTSNSYAPHWGGFEAGGFGSLNGNQMKFTDTLGATPGGVLGPFTNLTVGGGWFFGANYQFQRIVVGAEISGNYENANFNTAAAAGGATMFYHFAQVDRALAVTGRIGWLMTPDTLLYVKAGPSNMRMTPDARYWNAVAPNVVGGTTLAGYVAGVGVETFVLPNVSLRAEALYSQTNQTIVLNGVVPREFTLQPSIFSATIGAALHL